jgi:hypothetical protein
MPLVILHHLLNVFVQLANKRGLKRKLHKKRMCITFLPLVLVVCLYSNAPLASQFLTLLGPLESSLGVMILFQTFQENQTYIRSSLAQVWQSTIPFPLELGQ